MVKPKTSHWQDSDWKGFAENWEARGESKTNVDVDPNDTVLRIKSDLKAALKKAAGFTTGRVSSYGQIEKARRQLDSAIRLRTEIKSIVERYLIAKSKQKPTLERKLLKQMGIKLKSLRRNISTHGKIKLPEDQNKLLLILDEHVLEKRKDIKTATQNAINAALEKVQSESKSMVDLLKNTVFSEYSPPVLGVINNDTGNLTATPQELSEILTKHYESILNSPSNEPPLTIQQDKLREQIFNKKQIDSAIYASLMSDVTDAEVLNAFPKTMVAAGEDLLSGGIYSKMVEHSLTFRAMVTEIFNKCLKEGKSLEEGRNAIITPLWKDLNKTASADNTRPISLQCALSKGLMKILAERLGNSLAEHQILDKAQEGFLPGKSTHRAIELLRAAWRKSRYGKTRCYTSLYDISKAYDHVRHEDILLALERINLPKRFIQLIKSSLEQLTARVRTGFGHGKRFKINRGIRQGCPLSPLLFIILFDVVHCGITDLSEGISFGLDPKTKETLKIGSVGYADDLAVLSGSKQALNKIHDKICEITAALHLKINASKSVVLLPSTDQEDVGLEVDGIKIPTQTADKHFR